jgi:site-specific DNA recombinase
VFFYLEDRERTLDSPTDKLLMSVTAFADELEREKARQRTYDAMLRKAKAGHVAGGRVFGYTNVEIRTADGRRSHVERRIEPVEAAVVRRIFALSAEGRGLISIAHTLNAEGAASPKPQRGRPQSWAPSSVREVLHRPLYRGVIRWNATRKRDAWGRQRQQDRPAGEWVTLPAPELRIVGEDVCAAVEARQDEARHIYLRGTGGRLHGRPKGRVASKYLLPGLSRCALCEGGLYVKSRDHRSRRALFYGCSSYHYRGACANGIELPMDLVNDQVLDRFASTILAPDIVEAVIDQTVVRLLGERPDDQATERERLQDALQRAEVEIRRFTEAIGAGGELSSLLAALKTRESQRQTLGRQLAALEAKPTSRRDAEEWRRSARARFVDWRGCLSRNPVEARHVLSTLLEGPIRFTPTESGHGWTFHGRGRFEPLFSGLALSVASPAGVEPASPP